MVAIAYIGLGSNLGDGKQNIQHAWHKLGNADHLLIKLLSSPYKTKPVGIESKNWFTNAVGQLQTSLPPHSLLDLMLQIELQMGRDRLQGDDRPIDLDLLFYDDCILDEKGLKVPHPEIQNRLFVLTPLVEIAPDLIHPIYNKSVTELEKNLLSKIVDLKEQIQKTEWVG